jgi:hypothetical protein
MATECSEVFLGVSTELESNTLETVSALIRVDAQYQLQEHHGIDQNGGLHGFLSERGYKELTTSHQF